METVRRVSENHVNSSSRLPSELYKAAEMMETAEPVRKIYMRSLKSYDISITHFAYLRFCIVGCSLSVLF